MQVGHKNVIVDRNQFLPVLSKVAESRPPSSRPKSNSSDPVIICLVFKVTGGDLGSNLDFFRFLQNCKKGLYSYAFI